MPPPPTPQHGSPSGSGATSGGKKRTIDLASSSPRIPSSNLETRESQMEREMDLQQHARKERAAEILGSWEMLAWYSQHYGESIPQTRLRFQKEMIGLIDEFGSEEWKDEVEVAEEDKYPKDRKYGRVTKGESGDLSRGRKGLSGRD